MHISLTSAHAVPMPKPLPEPPSQDKGLADGFTGGRIQVIPIPTAHKSLNTPFLRTALTTDVGYFPDADKHFRERTRGADEAIIVVCTHGSVWVEVAEARHPVSPGQVILIPPHTPHSYGSTDGKP